VLARRRHSTQWSWPQPFPSTEIDLRCLNPACSRKRRVKGTQSAGRLTTSPRAKHSTRLGRSGCGWATSRAPRRSPPGARTGPRSGSGPGAGAPRRRKNRKREGAARWRRRGTAGGIAGAGPAPPASVQIALAAGQLDLAREAAAELEAIAGRYGPRRCRRARSSPGSRCSSRKARRWGVPSLRAPVDSGRKSSFPTRPPPRGRSWPRRTAPPDAPRTPSSNGEPRVHVQGPWGRSHHGERVPGQALS